MSDIGGRLVQLPDGNWVDSRFVQLQNGSWVDPREVVGVSADLQPDQDEEESGASIFREMRPVSQVFVHLRSKHVVSWGVPTCADAIRHRDETVRRLGAVHGKGSESGESEARMRQRMLADELEDLAEQPYLIDCGCHEVEKSLVDMRDDGTHVWCANYGLVIKDREGGDSCIIRMYFDEALRISLRRIAHQIRMQAKAGNSQENNHGNSSK